MGAWEDLSDQFIRMVLMMILVMMILVLKIMMMMAKIQYKDLSPAHLADR